MSTQFDHVSVGKKANIYFDGMCISYNLTFPDQTKKTLGVILPSVVTFDTTSPEIMEIVSGKCRARIGEAADWDSYDAGQRFQVPANSRFQLEALEPVHYVCHFG
ncbi:pyrimidine/purine nucleoside phosphorylase [Lacisediminimonas profundi]|uniref:pyrimidine/purine nucleoside phosphorylase n=1 Tax=Lacisediminimonas profundi TaxID=2603856 RepID=UPI00124B5735|nr:pyrimidine/purine nucleoside phosphorylase [Lacisediminimonas profundi]